MVGYQRTKSYAVLNQRSSFQSFYIVKEWSGNSDISSIGVGANERLNGAVGMRQITIDEIEKEFGTVEAQAMRLEVLENPEYTPSARDLISGMTVWTQKFVIQIGSNEMWEWLRAAPRNPVDYA